MLCVRAGEYVFGGCTGTGTFSETSCKQCTVCPRDRPNAYNSIYKACNGSDREDVVVCALNLPGQSMVGDTCPDGHHVVGRLDAIDSVLRAAVSSSSSSSSSTIRYNGIAPWLDQFVGAVAEGGQMMLSTTVGNNNVTTSTRIQYFTGEIHSTYQQTDGYDLFDRSPRPPNEPLVPPDMYIYPDMQRSMFFHFNMATIFAIAGKLPLVANVTIYNTIYMLNRQLEARAWRWTPVFTAGPAILHMHSCLPVYDLGRIGEDFSEVILCAATNTSGFLKIFQVDLSSGRFLCDEYWDSGWNVTLKNARYTHPIHAKNSICITSTYA